MTNGVASPSQASVSDLTDDAPAQSATPVSAPQTPCYSKRAGGSSAELKIYDTSSQPLDQVLAQVQQDGASIVVGPLLKNNVEALMKSNTPLNVLALNQPETVRSFLISAISRSLQKMKPVTRRIIFMTGASSRRCC